MKIILKILKSMLVGLGSITPGVSGSMIATSFGFYEELIDALDNFTKKPIEAILSIWEYIVGIFLGLILGIILIKKLIEVIPLLIVFFFIGLILGSLPEIIKSDKENKKHWYHYLIMFIAIGLILSLIFIKPVDFKEITGFKLYLVYMVIGFLIAVPMIIPGLSGATILMIIGFYNYFNDLVANTIMMIVNLDFANFFKGSVPLIVIALSAFVGLVLFAKLIKFIIKNHKTSFNMAVIGLLIVAPVNIIFSFKKDVPTLFNDINFLKILMSIILCIIGFSLTLYVGRFEGGNNIEQQKELS